MGASTLLQAKAQQQQTNAQVEQANAQAQQAEINAKIQARQSELIADQYADKQRQLNAKMQLAQGANTASAGASGVSSTTGSAFDVANANYGAYLDDSRNLLDAQRNEVYGSHIDEYNYKQSAENSRREASNAASSGRMGVLGTILGGATSIYGNLQKYKTVNNTTKTTVTTPYNQFFQTDWNLGNNGQYGIYGRKR